MQALCVNGTMQLEEWIRLAATLDVEGLEWYAGFLEMRDPSRWPRFRALVEDRGKTIPMLCCSPDFTHPDAGFRQKEIEKQRYWIDMAASLGASYCRVLSGQARPGIGVEEGIAMAAGCIEACLPHAEQKNIILILENHYKDDFWTYPEFARTADIFCRLVEQIKHPFFGVNYDPSNVLLAGEDPLELLARIADRVLTMHASDRYLREGSLDDLRREETNSLGYAQRLAHGEIGRGLIDYDALFRLLSGAGFDGWISVEDGVDGFDQLERSVHFLRRKIAAHWPRV
jgi:sugar phosphate isomerase/epimerase